MRRSDREITSESGVRDVLDEARIMHVGIFDDAYPYVVPLHYGYEFANGELTLYAHSARAGRKLELIEKNPHVCVEIDSDHGIISGGDTPCKYGSAYASLIGRGVAEIVADSAEKAHAIDLLMKHQTGRDFAISERMTATVAVVKITAHDFTAKRNPAD